MTSPTQIDGAPRQGAPADIERRADDGGRRHGAKPSREGASSEAAPVHRAVGELKTSNDARAAYASRAEASNVSARLVELTSLAMPALRSEWRRLFRRDAPRLSRDQMIRVIAYRIQEGAFGGLPKAVERRLAKLTGAFKSEGRIAAPSPPTGFVRRNLGRLRCDSLGA